MSVYKAAEHAALAGIANAALSYPTLGRRMRGLLLLLGLALVHARWALVFWPDFDVSMPNCAVNGVTGLELSYPELSCGTLSHTCFPTTCIDACTADVNCENIVVQADVRTCQFRCKEHLLDDFDMVPRLDYTTFQLISEETMETMDIGWGVDYTIVDSPPSRWAQWMIAVAALVFSCSLFVFFCTGNCTITGSKPNTPFGFAPKKNQQPESYQRLDEEQAMPAQSPDRRASTLAKEAAVKAREEAKAAAAAAKAAAGRAEEEAEAKAKAVADKKAKAEAEAKAKAVKEAGDADAIKAEKEAAAKRAAADAAKAKEEAAAKKQAAADAAKAEKDAAAKKQAVADAIKAEEYAAAKKKAAADAAKAEKDAAAKKKAEDDAIKEAEAKLKAAMPYPFQYADPMKLQPAIEAAKKAGVARVAIEAAEVKLNEALNKAKAPPGTTMTAAGLLENDAGRDQLVKNRFNQADDDNSGSLDTDEVIGLIRTL